LGRLAGAIWPAIAIAGACTAWAGSDDPADLANLRRQRDTAMLSIRHDADAKQARLDQEYQKALDDLYRRYVTQNDLGGAAAVLKERRAVFPGAEKPAEGLPAASQKFSWPSARKGLTYRYKSRNFAKAAYDYSDRACSKLLDGQFKEHAFEGTVAWDDESVAVVCFEFTFPVKPSRFRVHVLGGMPKNGYKPPRSVVVSDGDRNTPGREIGAAQNLKDKCDWVDIDIQPTRPSQYFWVAIEKADAQLVCIDEVEFR
jgi:hypothetical protein